MNGQGEEKVGKAIALTDSGAAIGAKAVPRTCLSFEVNTHVVPRQVFGGITTWNVLVFDSLHLRRLK